MALFPGITQAFRSLRNRNYRLFWFGQLVSLAGTWMQDVALSWLVLSLTNSPVVLGLTITIRFLPALLFSLYGGVLADRLRKRQTIVMCESTQLIVALALAVLTTTGGITVAIIYILAAVRGFVDSIEGPTRLAFVSEMVGKDDLPNAVALNSTLFNGARIAGPAVGAAIMLLPRGIEICFYLNAASFASVIVALLSMRVSELHLVPRLPRENAYAQLKEGFQYARSTPQVVVILIVMGVLGAFGYNFMTLLPLVTKYTLLAGKSTLALLTTSMGVGSVAAGLVAAYRGRPSQRLLLASAGIFVIVMVAMGLSIWVPVTAVLLFFMGVVGVLFMTSANTGLQLQTPDHLRGRVLGMYTLLFVGTTPIGSYLTGFWAEYLSKPFGSNGSIGANRLGVQLTVLLLAGLCAVGVIVGLIYARRHSAEARAAAALLEATARAEEAPGWSED